MRRIAVIAINLFVCPGAGHFAIGRPWRGVPWFVLQLAVWPLALFAPIGVFVAMLVARLGAAIEVGLLRDEHRGWRRIALSFGGGVMVMFVASMTLRAFVAEGFKIPSGG